jgi:uncharacterized membrane protein
MQTLISKWVVILLVTFALIGFFDSAYLTAEHYAGNIPPCFIATGCESVTTSVYSTVYGVPVALAGTIYYLLLFILSIGLLTGTDNKNLKWISIISGLGFLSSAYFVYLQLFVINAICSYCMVSAITTTLIFLTSTYQSRKVSQTSL